MGEVYIYVYVSRQSVSYPYEYKGVSMYVRLSLSPSLIRVYSPEYILRAKIRIETSEGLRNCACTGTDLFL